MADDKCDSLASLHGDADRVPTAAHTLGQLNGAVQRQRITDAHRQRLTTPEDHPFRKPLLSQCRDELLSISGRRHALDQHAVERAARLLAEADGLMTGLDQLALDALRFAGRGERPELDGEALTGWRRGRSPRCDGRCRAGPGRAPRRGDRRCGRRRRDDRRRGGH